MNQYEKMVRDVRRGVNSVTVETMKKTERLLENSILDMNNKVLNSKSGSLGERWAKEYVKALKADRKIISKQIEDIIKAGMDSASTLGAKTNYDMLNSFVGNNFEIGMSFKGAFAKVNTNVTNAILQGDIYSDGRSLSQRIWKLTGEFEGKVQDVINQGILQQKSTKELAKDLREFAKPPDKRPLSWRGDYESYKAYNINYSAKRLARTTINHAYQTATIESSQLNPFINKMRWETSGGHRVCEICASREGKEFLLDEVPLDHPNGMCVMIPVLEKDLKEVAKEIRAWIDGEDNPGLDNWYKKIEGYGSNGYPTKENTEKINKFIPAKTIQEAEENAKWFIGEGFAPKFKNKAIYKGISLEHANEINETLRKLYNMVDMPKLNGIKTISPTSLMGKKVFSDADAIAAYNPVEGGIFLNRDILKNAKALAFFNKQADEAWEVVMKNVEKLSGKQKELATLYKNVGRSLVGDGSLQDYIIHEMGHHVQWNVLDTNANNMIGSRMGSYAPKISGYANASKGEYLAESFTAYVKGELNLIDPEFVKALSSKVSEKLTFEMGIKDINTLFVKRNTGALPTVFLAKKEYAEVVSQINTYYYSLNVKQGIASKAIGNYLYTFEVKEFGEYRIIGRVLLID